MTIAAKKLVQEIKPLLSDTPIANVNINMEMGDCGRIVVEFVLTKEIIEAMRKAS